MNQALRLLVVEDREEDVVLLLRALSRGGYEVIYEVVDTPAAMRAMLERQDWDVITSDYSMPRFSAPAALALAKELCPHVPFIIVSDEMNLDLAVSLIKGGAQDYIQTQHLARLVPAIKHALREVNVCRERERAEVALQVSETHYRRLFEAARDGILMLDPVTCKITDVNPFMVELLGYSRDDLLGKELWEIGLLQDVVASRDAFGELQENGYIRYEDLPLQTKEGEHRQVEFVSNVYAENGHQVIQCNIRDMTARWQAEAEIRTHNVELEHRVRERTAQLELLNKKLATFNYAIFHDLSVPLHQIDSLTETLSEDYGDKLDQEGLQLIQQVRASTQGLKNLIAALLALSRFSRGELEWQLVDLSALARQIATELRQSSQPRRVEFVIAAGLTTNGDARLLRIMLENLLSNAWKFTAHHPTARIEFGVAPQTDESTAYFVHDDGAGFDMTDVDKLFGTFQRLHSDQEFPGTGVGLATVQRIIQRHGGRVWAEGAVDIGATFYFTL